MIFKTIDDLCKKLDPDEAPQNMGFNLRTKLFDIQINYISAKYLMQQSNLFFFLVELKNRGIQ